VVQNQPDLLDTIGGLLEEEGVSYESASTSMEAVRKILVGDYKIVLIDPGADGLDWFETALKIRRVPDLACVALVAITGEDENGEFHRKATEAGFSDFLEKPLKKSDVMRLLNKYMGADGIVVDRSGKAWTPEEVTEAAGSAGMEDGSVEELITSMREKFLESLGAWLEHMNRSLKLGEYEQIIETGALVEGTADIVGYPQMAMVGTWLVKHTAPGTRDEVERALETLSTLYLDEVAGQLSEDIART
jgi:CheY-like chemotaxis protein